MRAVTIAIFIAMLAGAAAAQEMRPPPVGNPPPSAERPTVNGLGRVPEAPVGHRQPTLRNLPPDVRREEGRRTVDPFADVPDICAKC